MDRNLRDRQVTTLISLFIVATVLLGLFSALPGLDLSASRLFCQHVAREPDDALMAGCDGFSAARFSAVKLLRLMLMYLPVLGLCIIFALWLRHLAFGRTHGLSGRRCALAIVAYGLGPLVVVNGLLKTLSGRPRPYETAEFGGRLPFVAAGDFSGHCSGNCSFVSGEAAAAGWLICLLPLVSGPYRRQIRLLLVTASAATPMLRLAMGGHYLSDILLGWLAGAAAYPLVVVLASLTRMRARPTATGS